MFESDTQQEHKGGPKGRTVMRWDGIGESDKKKKIN